MNQTQNKKKKAFTLVELIIVITILAILGTIAFISFNGYTKQTRDSVRLTDIKTIYDGLNIYKIQTSKTLLPDNYIEVQSGTTTLSYQGYAGITVQRSIKLNNGGKDPLLDTYYTYTTDKNTKKIQLMTYLETGDKKELLSQIFPNTFTPIKKTYGATTNTGYYEDKHIYVYGDKIGILTDENKTPIQETTTSTGIDLTTTTKSLTTYFGGNIYDSGKTTSTGTTLINQINGAINGTVPCNETTYDGYTITSLQDKENKNFTKNLTGITNGSGTGTITATCSNGTLSYTSQPNNLSCDTNYVPNTTNDNCVENICSGTLPQNAETNGTQTLGTTWSYSQTPGVCKFKCQSGYHTEDSGISCISDTNILTCGGTIPNHATATTSVTYNQTWDGSSWSSTYNWGENQSTCDFNCDSGYSWDGNSCIQVGSTQLFAGTNCNTIKQLNINSNNGIYWIDPNGGDTSDAYQVYCDMTERGGGWTKFDCLNSPVYSINKVSSSNIITSDKFDGRFRSTAGGAGGRYSNNTPVPIASQYRFFTKLITVAGGSSPLGLTIKPDSKTTSRYDTNSQSGIFHRSARGHSVGEIHETIMNTITGISEEYKDGSIFRSRSSVSFTTSASGIYYVGGGLYADSSYYDTYYSCWYK